MLERKLKGGIIGGGRNSFIGHVHLTAATFNHQAEIVAGIFSGNVERSRDRGRGLFIESERIYKSYEEMISGELELPVDDRIDFVIIATPNYTHYPIAKSFLQAGFHIICDKPVSVSLDQALDLKRIVEKTGKIFVLTHGYTGYPLIKQAKHLVSNGELGKIHRIVVEYSQGWLSPLLKSSESVSTWHIDPEVSGPSCAMLDIGIHAENLVRTITGLEIEELCADLTSFIETNPLDDDGSVLIHYKGGAHGILLASQVSTGEANNLTIRIYGDRMGLSWSQETPELLTVMHGDGCKTIYTKGSSRLCADAKGATKLPAGHPEGLFEAFSNIYHSAFESMKYLLEGKGVSTDDFPGIEDGVEGVAFVETVLESAHSDNKWTTMKS